MLVLRSARYSDHPDSASLLGALSSAALRYSRRVISGRSRQRRDNFGTVTIGTGESATFCSATAITFASVS